VGVSGANGAVFAYGLRNPFQIAIQPGTGFLMINDVGEGSYEEINFGVAAANYGWPMTEGPTTEPGITAPIMYYSHAHGCAITGGVFYNPQTPAFPPRFLGNYFYADYCAGFIRRLDPRKAPLLSNGPFGIVDLAVSPQGGLYYLARTSPSGSLFVINATPAAVDE
jgi:glucose/arabinose dehydrogenase